MKNPKVSIIVPVYNVEKYLDECLHSLVNQTYSNIEIILVDDGSQDNSGMIMEEYRKNDDRIKVINQKNKGPGTARNVGIKEASGKYIMFLDSDDYYDLNAVKLISEAMEDSDCDVIIFNGRAFDDDGKQKIFRKSTYFNLNKKHANQVKHGMFFVEQSGGRIQQLCMKIFNKDFLSNNNLFFLDRVCGQDAIFLYESMLIAQRVMYVDFIGFFRRYRANSIMTSSGIRNIQDRIKTFDRLRAILDSDMSQDHKKIISRCLARYASLLWIMSMNKSGKERGILIGDFYNCKLDQFLKMNKCNFVTWTIWFFVAMPNYLFWMKSLFAKTIKFLLMRIFKSETKFVF